MRRQSPDPERTRFTAVYQRRGKWFVATVAEVPGVNTQGRTLAQARRNLLEALALVLEANRELSERDRTGPTVRREPLVLETGS